MREELTKVEALLSSSSTICALITGDGNLSLSIFKDKTIKTGNQVLHRKIKLLLTEDEIRSFTHSIMSKTQTRVYPPRLLLMSKHTVGEETDKNDPLLPEEIQHLVKEERLHKIVL